MFLKFRYRLGYESLCAEVSDCRPSPSARSRDHIATAGLREPGSYVGHRLRQPSHHIHLVYGLCGATGTPQVSGRALGNSGAKQDVFQMVCRVRETSRLCYLTWGHMNTLASWAEQLAQALLQKPLPRRWAHVQGVAARARSLAPVLGPDADLLEAAAWMHDVGYAPDLAVTGLHQLDGARYLRDTEHADAMLCRLVAYHSCTIIEADERGLADILSPSSTLHQTCCPAC